MSKTKMRNRIAALCAMMVALLFTANFAMAQTPKADSTKATPTASANYSNATPSHPSSD